jgi:hypothetical protein
MEYRLTENTAFVVKRYLDLILIIIRESGKEIYRDKDLNRLNKAFLESLKMNRKWIGKYEKQLILDEIRLSSEKSPSKQTKNSYLHVLQILQ